MFHMFQPIKKLLFGRVTLKRLPMSRQNSFFNRCFSRELSVIQRLSGRLSVIQRLSGRLSVIQRLSGRLRGIQRKDSMRNSSGRPINREYTWKLGIDCSTMHHLYQALISVASMKLQRFMADSRMIKYYRVLRRLSQKVLFVGKNALQEIRRSFYIDISVGKIIGKFLPVRMWRRTKTEWFRLLKTRIFHELHNPSFYFLRFWWICLFSLLRPIPKLCILLLYNQIFLFVCGFVCCFGLLQEPTFCFDSIESATRDSSTTWTESSVQSTTGTDDSFYINYLLEPEPLYGPAILGEEEALAHVRAQNTGTEAALYSRIQQLEADLSHMIPPQLNPGEYEGLVRDHLNNAFSASHYTETLTREVFEISILERKSQIQDLLFQLLMGDPQVQSILELSPSTNIREEAYEFIQHELQDVNNLSLRWSFQRHLLEARLNYFRNELSNNGMHSHVYSLFIDFVTDSQFRRDGNPP